MPLNILSKYALQQAGGFNKGMVINPFMLFVVSILIFLIKAFLVQWSYNTIMPKFLEERYRPLTFNESIILIILIQSLFR